MERDQPTVEIDPREVVTAYLERERAAWIPARDRALRSGGMNAEHNAAEAKHMRQIDALLDELGRLGLSGAEVSHG